ncbi:MAG: DUF4286 family protein [Flavobacteriales bacterium]|nr:DUF4286 family protein [Flavobacteriales bacterium]
MIVYNVTCHVDPSILEDWLNWMKHEHLPEVMATGKFISFRFLRIDPVEEGDDGNSFAIQYTAAKRSDYEEYVRLHGPSLKAKTLARYGDRVLAFRTTLELISES